MEHKCRALEGRRLSIDYDYDERGWYIRGGAIKDCCIVFYCPYCGEKLEQPMPDIKIEVSQKVLRRWRGIIASDVCYRGMTADGIRKIQAEMGLLLND